MFLDNYIVRIYRDKKDNPGKLVGVVEEVGVDGKKAFTNLDELWEILNNQKRAAGLRGIKKDKKILGGNL